MNTGNETKNNKAKNTVFDQNLWSEDIAGGQAQAQALKEQGAITPRDCELIVAGLNLIKKDFEAGVDLSKPEDKDVHMLIDRVLMERIGQAGKKLHNARLCSN